MRDNIWLAERLKAIHRDYFIDISIPNQLLARFGRSSKTRLGSISSKRDPENRLISVITLTGFFQAVSVPEFILDATLAHELAHYTHGFHSPHQRQYSHPHRGNVVGRELKERGADHLVQQQQQWLKEHWRRHLAESI